MKEDRGNTSISATVTHGTAATVIIPSLLPSNKSEKEVFWANALIKNIHVQPLTSVQANTDDSYGNHDVIITSGEETIGIQVTELTSELQKKRNNLKNRYLKNIISYLISNNISSNKRVIVTLQFPFNSLEKAIKAKNIPKIAKSITAGIRETKDFLVTENFRLLFQYIDEGGFYVPNINNIGVTVTFDQISRSLQTYHEAAEVLAHKKLKSKSPWLLIWSLEFWKDKHTFGENVISHLQKVFWKSTFDRVYFIESLDGSGYFEANLTLHVIKE